MKKRIFSIALVIALLAVVITGGTIAYLKDTDAQKNVFVVGNVEIDLFEDFNSEGLHLIPAVGKTDPVTGYAEYKNSIEKEVYVKNTGSESAYVRVHIAIPALTRDGNNINVIDLLRDEYNTVDGTWNWGTTPEANFPHRDGGEWNLYRNVTIDGVPFKVFVVTYETALKKGDVTPDAINKVYMDPMTTNEEIDAWNTAYGANEWATIYVAAEAVQSEGFDNAFDALNTAFGVPGTYAVDWKAVSNGETFVEFESGDGN